jgi:phage-related protein
MAWNVEFYEKPSGKKPIEEFLDDLPKKAKAKCDSYIEKFQELGFELPGNYLEKLEDNLWALRPEFGGNEYRILFCKTAKETVCIVHAALKNTRRLASNDLETARRRRKELTGK